MLSENAQFVEVDAVFDFSDLGKLRKLSKYLVIWNILEIDQYIIWNCKKECMINWVWMLNKEIWKFQNITLQAIAYPYFFLVK